MIRQKIYFLGKTSAVKSDTVVSCVRHNLFHGLRSSEGRGSFGPTVLHWPSFGHGSIQKTSRAALWIRPLFNASNSTSSSTNGSRDVSIIAEEGFSYARVEASISFRERPDSTK